MKESLKKILNFFKSIWIKFLSLKRWQQVLIVIFLLFLIGSSSEEPATNSTGPSQRVELPTPTPTPTSVPTSAPTPTTTPTTTPTPESPIEFRFSALRDLSDMRKDVEDARIGITENGLGKYSWNVFEITFNLTQLKSLTPRAEYEQKWNSRLVKLETAVNALDIEDENLTISIAKKRLQAVLNEIPALESLAKSLAN
jgi:hypothetical protein